MPLALSCGTCSGRSFRLRRAEGGAEAECTKCGEIIQNSVVRAATRAISLTFAPPPVNPDADTT